MVWFLPITFSLFLFAQPKNLALLENERFLLDLKYSSTKNFLGENIYKRYGLSKCFVRNELKEKLEQVVPALKNKNLKLILWDCYRPLAVQEAMWKLVPDPRYVADPKKGSNHNRGAAVDVALADDKGNFLEFPSGFDDFTEKASPNYRCKKEEREKCQNRDLLIRLMSSVGLEVFPTEWWHFQLPRAEDFPLFRDFESAK